MDPASSRLVWGNGILSYSSINSAVSLQELLYSQSSQNLGPLHLLDPRRSHAYHTHTWSVQVTWRVRGQRRSFSGRCFQGFVDLGWTHLSGPDQAELQDSGSEEEVSFTENRAQVSLMTTLHLTEAAEQPNPGRLPAQRPGPEPELTDESDHLHRRTRRMPGRYCSVLLAAEHERR